MIRTVFIPVRATGATKGDRKSWWETDNFLTARPIKPPKTSTPPKKKTALKSLSHETTAVPAAPANLLDSSS